MRSEVATGRERSRPVAFRVTAWCETKARAFLIRLEAMSDGAGGAASAGDRRRRLAGIAISTGLVGLAVILAIVGSGGGGDSSQLDGVARFVSVSEIRALEGELGHSIYWAGERSGRELELTAEADGSVYLRYLSPGVEAGDPRAEFLTVGTYPVADAQGALRRTAAKAGSGLGRVAGGGLSLANPSSEGSVYLAYPDSDLEIEVFDPSPGRALRLIRSGAIQPVG
jgi:hypothetical protein